MRKNSNFPTTAEFIPSTGVTCIFLNHMHTGARTTTNIWLDDYFYYAVWIRNSNM